MHLIWSILLTVALCLVIAVIFGLVYAKTYFNTIIHHKNINNSIADLIEKGFIESDVVTENINFTGENLDEMSVLDYAVINYGFNGVEKKTIKAKDFHLNLVRNRSDLVRIIKKMKEDDLGFDTPLKRFYAHPDVAKSLYPYLLVGSLETYKEVGNLNYRDDPGYTYPCGPDPYVYGK